MRVYIPNSNERDIEKSLTELELFKQTISSGDQNHSHLLRVVEKVINLLETKPDFKSVLLDLKRVHLVIGVETSLSLMNRIKNIIRDINSVR
jgi:hypothetical protein